jgi:hypothetical protein
VKIVIANYPRHCELSPSLRTIPVIANAVKQSMTPDCMDCRASLAVTWYYTRRANSAALPT